MKIKEVFFLDTGNIVVFDEKGKQIQDLQLSTVELFAKHCKSKGYEPDGIIIKTHWGLKLKIFKTFRGYNWRVTKNEISNF